MRDGSDRDDIARDARAVLASPGSEVPSVEVLSAVREGLTEVPVPHGSWSPRPPDRPR